MTEQRVYISGWCRSAPGTKPDAHHDQCRVVIGGRRCGCVRHGESSTHTGETSPTETTPTGKIGGIAKGQVALTNPALLATDPHNRKGA